MKLKNFVIMALFAFAAFMVVSCKSDSVNGGEGKSYDTVEILYERVFPIVSPQYNDPTGFNLFSYDHGGHTLSCKKIGENQWMASIDLPYSNSPNMVFVMDAKIIASDVFAHAGRKFSVRIRGQDQWIEVTRITPQFDGYGEQAEFILKGGVIITNF